MYDIVPQETAAPLQQRSQLLPAYTVSTRHYATRAQFGAWVEMLGPPVAVTVPGGTNAGFAAEQTAWHLGDVVLTHSTLPATSVVRSARRLRADGLDHWIFTSLVRGATQTIGAGRFTRLTPARLKLQSLHAEFETQSSDVERIDLFVPRDFCRGVAARLDAADNTELSSGLARLLAHYLQDLARRLPTMSVDELPGLLATLKAMIVACVAPSNANLADASETIQATLLERARRLIQQHLHSPTLGPDELCIKLNVSRSRLYRLFEAQGGVMHYIRRRRLLDVHAALANADDQRTIVQIAAERGFYDAAEFSRAFKREFGYRPTDARSRGNTWPVRLRSSITEESGNGKLASLLARLR